MNLLINYEWHFIKGFFHKSHSQSIMVGGMVPNSSLDQLELRKISADRIIDRVMNNIRFWVGLVFFGAFWWGLWYYLWFIDQKRRSFAVW